MIRFFLLFLALLGIANADPTERFAAANKAFADDDFDTAYSGYQSLLDDGHINADLLYNLGNTSYRKRDLGEAALWYGRTLTLDPTHTEARQNLRFLKRTEGFLDFEPTQLEETVSSFRKDTLLRIASLTGWLAALGVTAALTLRLSPGIKTAVWITAPILGLVALASATGIYLKHQRLENLGSQVIVTAKTGKAYTAPARSAETIIDLPPGSQLKIVTTRGDWNYTDLPGELRGWIPKKSAKKLWPYDPALAD